jgi:hypothetical protein
MFNFEWEVLFGEKLGHSINMFFGVIFFWVGIRLLKHSGEFFDFGGGTLMAIMCALVALEVCMNQLFKGASWYGGYIANGWIEIKERHKEEYKE